MSHESRTLLCRTSLTRPWILCCLVAAVTMVCFSITIGWRLGVSDLEGSSPRPSAARSVLFTLDVVALDPLQNIVTLDWRILADDCVAGPVPSAECPVVNIYVNPCVFLICYFCDVSSMAREIQRTISKLWWTGTSTPL